jgi:SAM-dependent methyltransferase
LKQKFPHFRELKIHESSPLDYVAKAMFGTCRAYSASHYWQNIPSGSERWGYLKYLSRIRPLSRILPGPLSYVCQDLEHLVFPDESFDLFVTMDVMEHILDPSRAWREIDRVLKLGGAHIFTVPIFDRPESIMRAYRNTKGETIHMMPPDYHGNPLGGGSLVTWEWGRDIVEYVERATGEKTEVYSLQDKRLGILGAMTDVLVCRKS